MEEQLSSSLSDRAKIKGILLHTRNSFFDQNLYYFNRKIHKLPSFLLVDKTSLSFVCLFFNLSFHSRDFSCMHHHELPTITCSVFCGNKLN